MRYGTDNSDSSNRYRGGAVSPSSYQNNGSSLYHSNYDYQPPSVAGTYAQQQTYVMEDTMRTHYEVCLNQYFV